jgi:hypothetical protein
MNSVLPVIITIYPNVRKDISDGFRPVNAYYGLPFTYDIDSGVRFGIYGLRMARYVLTPLVYIYKPYLTLDSNIAYL